MKLIECVPNFSEGRDPVVIGKITACIEKTTGVKLLNVDPGKATNRTVVTFVGEPAQVVEAAFQAIKTAAELIDMRNHTGAHPRMGATDVCPFIPISGITMEETVQYSRQLAERVGRELSIPVYLYEEAQPAAERKNLSVIRAGEYEGFFKKIKQPEWKPDYGPAEFPAHCGATVIGARDFLVAYNVNLNTTSVRRANSVAFDVRENGRKVKNEKGVEIIQPGSCKAVKAIGWYIEEYGIAQVSMNLTNISTTPIHIAFDECVKSAYQRGMRVTGSELVGLIPLNAMLEAGKYFLRKQKRSVGLSEPELVKIAVKSMGLDELSPFNPQERIIEYRLEANTSNKLVNLTLVGFADETASESPAPGGGSVSAYAGALGVALGTMVANLSSHKKGWDDRWEAFSEWAEKGQQIKSTLIKLVDEDTISFNKVMEAYGLPKSNEEEKRIRTSSIQQAMKYAAEVPLKVAETCCSAFELIINMVKTGNPNSITDAGVGALCIRAAVIGACLNVKVNAAGIVDKNFVENILTKANQLQAKAIKFEEEILELVEKSIQG